MTRKEKGQERGRQEGPSRLAELILRLTLPMRHRDTQLGDLREAFFTLQRRVGRSKARRWYRSQVLRSVVPNLALRMRLWWRPTGSGHRERWFLGGALAQDLHFMIRSFRRRPAFYSTMILVFGLGIGANTVIFSVVDHVLLRPLPYPEPDRLVIPWQTDPHGIADPNPVIRAAGHRVWLSYPVYQDWLEQNTVFENLGVSASTTYIATGDGQAERIRGTRATHGVFAALGVPPVLGRTFSREDDRVGGPRLVILSHGFWQRRFGSDSNIIGQTIVLTEWSHNEHPFTIVGVMPPEFGYPGDSEVWTTFDRADHVLLDRDTNFARPVARLRPNVTVDQAQREMADLAERLKEIHPIPGKDYGVNIVNLSDDMVRAIRPALLLLLGTVGIFLFISCANVGNLLLVRAAERRSELAVRLSLGAGRSRILRQLLTEGLSLSVVGGVLGSLVAVVCVDPFVSLLPTDTPHLAEIGVDARVLAFSILLMILTGVIVGALPAFGTARTHLATILQEVSRGSSRSRRSNRTQAWLLVSQIALTFVLLFGAGILAKSFIRLTSVERGFDAEGIITLELDMRGSRYSSGDQQRAGYQELEERLAAIPGVTALAATRAGPFLSTWSNDMMVETATGQVYARPLVDWVSGSYFQTMGIPLLAGRTFLADESFPASPVAIVNDAMARRFWPNESAVGKRIRRGTTADSGSTWLTIVGVVGDVRHQLDAEPRLTVYDPLSYGNPMIILKTGIDPTQVLAPARAAVRAVDPAIPVAELRILEQTIGSSVAGPRVRTVLLGALAGLAATLAVVGIFSVLAYAVAQRTNEIGIRMALGAAAGDVVRSVVKRGLALLGLGVAAGLAVSMTTVRTLERFLFEVDPVDPSTLLLVTLLLCVATIAAAFFPARRAATVDPVEVLNRE